MMHGGQMKHKLMNRSVGLCGPAEKERQCRLVSNVFNFEVRDGGAQPPHRLEYYRSDENFKD